MPQSTSQQNLAQRPEHEGAQMFSANPMSATTLTTTTTTNGNEKYCTQNSATNKYTQVSVIGLHQCPNLPNCCGGE